MPTTTAEQILEAIQGASAVTLYGGYAMFPNGRRVTFEAAHVLVEVRNEQDRCTLFHGRYDDGSQLHFSWHPTRGTRYRTFKE